MLHGVAVTLIATIAETDKNDATTMVQTCVANTGHYQICHNLALCALTMDTLSHLTGDADRTNPLRAMLLSLTHVWVSQQRSLAHA